MRDIDLALSEIAHIRAHLAASTCFLGIAPGFNLLTALIVFCVALAQSLSSQSLAQDPLGFIGVWAAVLVAISGVAVVKAISRARRLHGQMAVAMLQAALQKVLPFAAAGVTVTWTICAFAPENAWLLPGLWLILIGLLGFTLVSSLPRDIIWVAGWFFGSGTVVLTLAAQTETLSPWMMGVPLVVGQTLVALILGQIKGEGRA